MRSVYYFGNYFEIINVNIILYIFISMQEMQFWVVQQRWVHRVWGHSPSIGICPPTITRLKSYEMIRSVVSSS